jgi:L,D-transpeptidase YcbB
MMRIRHALATAQSGLTSGLMTGLLMPGLLMLAPIITVMSTPSTATSPPEGPAGIPPPVSLNWPPQPPVSASPTATTVEPKPDTPAASDEAAKAQAPTPPAPTPPGAAQPASTQAAVEPEKPAFTLGPDLTARLKALKPADAKSRADRDAAVKVYDARQGAPLWLSEDGFKPEAIALMNEIKGADSYGLQASTYKLPTETWSGKPTPDQLVDAESTLSLAALLYARHARGDRIDPASLSKLIDRKAQVYEPSSVLTELGTAAKPDAYIRALHPSHPQFERLRLKYLAVKTGQNLNIANAPPPPAPEQPAAKTAAKKGPVAPAPLTNAQLEKKLLANMEMWRWMPEMGATHIQNNIPEFTTRLVRDGQTVHLERIVTGKPDTPTPIFSDTMSIVVFKPFWNVPESIKWKELQPQLARNPGSLAKAGLRAAYNGKEVDPASVDWTTTDLRAFHVFQPPGAGNALGVVKFLFPNKHDVYMHDTPQKPLFEHASRAYSHGCMRVRDPLKFAELLLAHDKGMTRAQVNQLAATGPENNEVRLSKKVPIHITYFTAHVDDDGALKTFSDIYAHEKKVHLGLDGKQHLIEQPRIESEKAPPRSGAIAFRKERQEKSDPVGDWVKKIFSF